jgi:hypothetical protein
MIALSFLRALIDGSPPLRKIFFRPLYATSLVTGE